MTGYVHPSDWPVQPRAWTVTTVRGVEHVAALMPYPVLHPEDAACAGDTAFTDDLPSDQGSRVIPRLIGVCNTCPLQVACAEWGIAHERYQIFGGLTPEARAGIRKDRRQVVVEPSSAHVYGLREEDHIELRRGNGDVTAMLEARGIFRDQPEAEPVHPLDVACA